MTIHPPPYCRKTKQDGRVVICKPRLPKDYARKSEELLAYVGSLESEIESLKSEGEAEKTRNEQEKRDTRKQIEIALEKVNEAQRQIRMHLACSNETQKSADLSKQQLRVAEEMLQQERDRGKELEARIQELEEETRRKDKLINQRRKRDSRVRKLLQCQNESLKKKATLAWMLGCLSDAYLELEAADDKTATMLKMVRKLQRDLEHESLALNHGENSTRRVECHYIENEIRRLLELSDGSLDKAEESSADDPCTMQPPELETGRSRDEDQYPAAETEKYKASRRKEGSPGRSPRKSSESIAIAEFVTHTSSRFSPRESIVNQVERTTETVKAAKELSSRRLDKCSSDSDHNAASDHVNIAEPLVGRKRCADEEDRWADFKVLKKRQAERLQILKRQTEIMNMLDRLKTTIPYLIDGEERIKLDINSNKNKLLHSKTVHCYQMRGGTTSKTTLRWRSRPWKH